MTIGNGIMLAKEASLIITGTSENIDTTNYEIINKTNFPNLTFNPIFDGLLAWNETTGEFTIKDSGILLLDATINVQASQAAAEFYIIPQFDFDDGNGWVVGVPRKSIITAIKPDQLEFHGTRYFGKGSKMRFWVKAASGNITFLTETLDEGGPLEAVLPAAIFYISSYRRNTRISI